MSKNISVCFWHPKFPECLGIIWLVTDPFILTVHGITNLSFICFPLHPRNTAGETVVCSSLTSVLVETSMIFMAFVMFAIAALLQLILLSTGENHQIHTVGYCADIFTIRKDVYIIHSAHYCSFLYIQIQTRPFTVVDPCYQINHVILVFSQ
jgi:hypothetical protein